MDQNDGGVEDDKRDFIDDADDDDLSKPKSRPKPKEPKHNTPASKTPTAKSPAKKSTPKAKKPTQEEDGDSKPAKKAFE